MKPFDLEEAAVLAMSWESDSIFIRKDDMLALLRERQLLRDALTMAQERCGRLLEECRELKGRLGE